MSKCPPCFILKRCSRCGETKRRHEFARCSAKRDGLQNYCRVCVAERRHAPKRRHVRPRLIERMDRNPTRCMHLMFTNTPCLRKAKWRNGEWRACDAHRLEEDIPYEF